MNFPDYEKCSITLDPDHASSTQIGPSPLGGTIVANFTNPSDLDVIQHQFLHGLPLLFASEQVSVKRTDGTSAKVPKANLSCMNGACKLSIAVIP